MTRFPTLDAPSGQTVEQLITASASVPADKFQRIPEVNPQVLKYGDNDNVLPVAPTERKAVVQIVVGFLALLWLATRKRAL